ncbi:MAG TPA: ribosome silencing factor [Verrucomicrobiae bacterium]|nr:ribosome silencing factor [Verrucomicrobiae bacterium]
MQAKKIAQLAKELIEDKKGEEPVVLDISKQTSIAHYFVITHGNSAPHVKALGHHLMESMKKKKVPLFNREGLEAGEWVLLDFGSVIVHIFHREKRTFYHLESLWGEE